MAMSDAEMRALRDNAAVARLATANPDGTPHVVPVVFATVGDVIYSPIDGKPKRARRLARVRNITANPRAALLIDHYEDDWSKLRWLRLDVMAKVEIANTAAIAALTAKYPQYGSTPVLTADRLMLALEPLRWVAWTAADG